jgi:hypothetical protein
LSQPTEPVAALTPLEFVEQLAAMSPELASSNKVVWLIDQARVTLGRVQDEEWKAKIADLQKGCDSQAERISDFCDTIDNALGQGMAGPEYPAFLEKLGLDVDKLREMSDDADRLQSAWEEFHDEVKALMEDD